MFVNGNKFWLHLGFAFLLAACGGEDSGSGGDGATTSNGSTVGVGQGGADSQDITTDDQNGNNNGNSGSGSNGGSGGGSGPSIPIALAAGITFTDLDNSSNELQGDVNITKATDESNIDYYALYWGSNATTKLNGTAIQTTAVSGSDFSVNLAADTAIPGGATHFLIYSVNAAGESTSATALNITELVRVETYLNSGSDDWYWEQSGAAFEDAQGDLYIDDTNSYAFGLRFANLAVPQGASIITAFLHLTYLNIDNNSATVYGHNADSGGNCSSAATCDLLMTSVTTATTAWQPFSNYTTSFNRIPGEEMRNIVTEITSRPGWSSGNAMTFFFENSGTGASRIAAQEFSVPTNDDTSLVVEFRHSL